MELEYGFLCDYADSFGDKVMALGVGIQTINSPEVPFVQKHLSFVARFKVPLTEVGAKRVRLEVIDSDGEFIRPSLDASMEVPQPKTGDKETLMEMMVGIENLRFNVYGNHTLLLSVDGVEMYRTRFSVQPPSAT